MADDLKEQKDNQREVNNIIKNAANENIDDEEIEGELNKLNNNDFDGGDNIDDFLPDPQKNKIILNDEEKDKNKNKE